ncbi:MAG: S9 family peptidase, partial [Porphyromonadaceae bacterium]|nr:S9 family peptidase [Porphyromonadaceae bacterium]
MNKLKTHLMVLAGMITLGSSSAVAQSFSYPDARRDQTVDNYFGHKVADPYRWMENDTTQEVAKWVKQENALTNAYLQKIPFRQSLYDELKRLYSEQPFSGAPMKHGNKYFFYKQDGLQNQAVLYVKDGIDGKARVFLNPNTLSKDGTVALTDISFSNDNKYMAYSISRSGSDWREIFVKSTSTGKDLPDHILWAKFTNMAWKGDGFFYSAYDAPVKGKEFSNVNEGHKIYYHKLGDDYKQDKLIYENKKYPKRFYSVNVYDNPNYLFLDEDGMAEGNNIIIKNLKENKSPFTTITPDCKYRYTVVASDKKHFYVLTNNGAERYRLMQASYSNPDFKNWKELVGQQTGVLENAQIIGKNFILTYNQDASTHLYLYNMNGKKIREIDLPVIGNADVSG